MTTHEKALEAAAKAIRSDIWEREPNPTTERYLADLRQQAKDQAETAIAAYISALLPGDAAGLVERLEKRPIEGEYVLQKWARERDEAASLIQSQAAGWAADKARIAELEAVLEPFVRFAEHIAEQKPGWNHNDFVFAGPLHETRLTMKDFRAARVLLNGERKG